MSRIGRFDGENYQIGLLDICMQEYGKMIDVMQECHKRIYEVANGDINSYDTLQDEIPAVHC